MGGAHEALLTSMSGFWICRLSADPGREFLKCHPSLFWPCCLPPSPRVGEGTALGPYFLLAASREIRAIFLGDISGGEDAFFGCELCSWPVLGLSADSASSWLCGLKPLGREE